MFRSFRTAARRPIDRRRTRPALENLEGRLLLASGPTARPPAAVIAHFWATASVLRTDIVDDSPPTLLELGQMAIQQAGRGASNPKIVHELIDLLVENVGFNLQHSLGESPTPSELESAFEAAWGADYGYDCITLSNMAALALQEVHVPGEISVETYIPDPGNPKKAIVGSLESPPISNPDPAKSYEIEGLFDRHGKANNFEAALVYTYRGKTDYFPGGTEYVYSNPNKILTIFKSLGWCCLYDSATGNYDLEDGVIHRYRGPARSIPLR